MQARSEDFDPDIFVDGLKKTPFLCNSDKYSFILNLKYPSRGAKKDAFHRLFNGDGRDAGNVGG